MSVRCCFVPKCDTGYASRKAKNKKNNKRNPSLFKAPQDTTMLQKWQQAISRADKTLSSNDAVCELHFVEEDILRFYETKLPDGSVNKIERGKRKLKDGALPCIFPNLPKYLSKIVLIKRKNQNKKSDSSTTRKKRLLAIGTVATSPELQSELSHERIVNIPVANTSFGHSVFEALKENLNKVTTPNGNWSGTFIPGMNRILFAEWDCTYSTKKRVVIKQDLSVTIFFGNTEAIVDGVAGTVQNVLEIENVLKLVNRLTVCKGVKMISISDSCSGFVPERKPGLSSMCVSCLQTNKKNIKRTRNALILQRNDKLKGVVRCAKRKNSRLKLKVHRNAFTMNTALVEEEMAEWADIDDSSVPISIKQGKNINDEDLTNYVESYHKDKLTKSKITLQNLKGDRPFNCNVCNRKYTSRSILNRHLKIHTGEGKHFCCSICDYRSSWNSHLIEHMKTHTGEKPFSCSYCEYKCSQKSMLTTHLKSHTGEKSFHCTFCDYKTSRKWTLANHIQNHIGDKPFECNVCNRKYSQRSVLNRHLKIHTGELEKGFCCNVCDYKSSLKSDLDDHMTVHNCCNSNEIDVKEFEIEEHKFDVMKDDKSLVTIKEEPLESNIKIENTGDVLYF